LCDNSYIGLADLPAIVRAAGAPVGAELRRECVGSGSNVDTASSFAGLARSHNGCLDQAECKALLCVLEANRWHMTRVAEHLGISRNTLYRKLRKHGIAKGA